MRTAANIEALLPELDHCIADELEDQDLDFKQWDLKSRDNAVKTVVQMAVCMANGGGGTVVFGVADRIQGRSSAILGVPPEIDSNLLKKAVYDQTDPKIMPVFEALSVPEGTGRLLLMQIYPGLPPYTDSKGRGTVRIGKDCQPLTGTLRRKIAVETGETDLSAEVVNAPLQEVLSPTAMETLRNLAKQENAPSDLLQLEDRRLLQSLGVLPDGKLTKAAVMLVGSETAIRQYLPGHYWLFLHMTSDTDYDLREDRVTSIPQAIERLEALIHPYNPLTTSKQGFYHFEYSRYPEIAVREALMNAFCHADYRLSGPVMIKLYDDRMEISNKGGFIAGITPDNILHHQPAARNPLLVEALTRLRLVNRSNLGVGRIYSAFLMEGKRLPVIREIGESVTVTFPESPLDADFRTLVADASKPPLNVDELQVLSHLWRKPTADTDELAAATQITKTRLEGVCETLVGRGLAEQASEEFCSHWRLATAIRKKYSRTLSGTPREQMLTLLRLHPGQGLAIAEMLEETVVSRSMAKRVLEELRKDGLAHLKGKGRAARWFPGRE
jgi:ATP-dependent DNA helicase RecG